MADQSTMDQSTAGDASSYVSQSTVDPSADNKASGSKKRLLAVAFFLAILVALLTIFFVFSGTSSSSAAHAAGDDDDTTSQPPSSYAGGNGGGASGGKNTPPAPPGPTTQRPIPPFTLVCVYGTDVTLMKTYPYDGLCDFIALEQMPSEMPSHFGKPYKPYVKHFVETAAKYSKTEFVACFDYGTIHMPDMFISKAAVIDSDSDDTNCRILPPNLLKSPDSLEEINYYFYNLYTAVKHLSDLDKLRDQGIKTTALSVSVGVYGRWYSVPSDGDGGEINYKPGNQCSLKDIDQQKDNIKTACEVGEIEEYKPWHCSYMVKDREHLIFVFEKPASLKYKLCTSKRNVTSLQYGITAVGAEYSDADNVCGFGRFPLLTAIKNTLMFFRNQYSSPDQYDQCVSSRRSAEEGPTTEDQ